jgi:GTP-binding protein
MIIRSAEFVKSAAKDSQYPPAELPEFAFAGRSNVGKSSLINTLVNRKKLVLTSSTPGKTRLINFFCVNGELMLVDLPGYGYARVSREERRTWAPMIERYLATRTSLKGVVALFDIRRSPGPEDIQLMDWLAARRIPRILVATKSDKLSKTAQAKQLAVIAGEVGAEVGGIVLFSAKSRRGRDALWKSINDLARKGG